MKVDALKSQLQELSWMLGGIRRGEYPDFVVKKNMSAQIPVFNYHRVDKHEFYAQLRYLNDNDYKTLDADEYANVIKNHEALPERTVVLTFDDGLSNLYETAYPLLKSYGMKAVVFIIPAWVGKDGSITWEQANEMHAAGVIDFQSHTMHHAGIFISPEVVDFYSPQYSAYQVWNIPVSTLNGEDRYFKEPESGAPIFEYASRLSDHRRYYPEESLVDVCVKFVRNNGGKAFFRNKKWRTLLTDVLEDYRKTHSFTGYYEAEEEQEKRIRDELIQSKNAIEAKIPGKVVRHFAFPNNQTGKITNRLLEECGYETAYGGLSREYSNNGQLNNLYYINRVSGDFIFRLPGKGRLSFPNIFLSKIKRRLMKGVQY